MLAGNVNNEYIFTYYTLPVGVALIIFEHHENQEKQGQNPWRNCREQEEG